MLSTPHAREYRMQAGWPGRKHSLEHRVRASERSVRNTVPKQPLALLAPNGFSSCWHLLLDVANARGLSAGWLRSLLHTPRSPLSPWFRPRRQSRRGRNQGVARGGSCSGKREPPADKPRASFLKPCRVKTDTSSRKNRLLLAPAAATYVWSVSLAMVATRFFTASTLFWNPARSVSVSSSSMTRSTPAAPRMTGTPT